MRAQTLLITMLLSSAAIAQAPPSASGNVYTTQMATPPPVSGVNYVGQVGSEVQHNYLRGGLVYTTSYIDNYLAGSTSAPIAETTISFLPSIAVDTSSTRQHIVAVYSPGFTFYYPSSTLNEIDNIAAVDYTFHLSPHATISASDRFQDSSSPFFPANADTGIPGSPVSSTPGVVPPFAKRLSNSADAEITMQVGLNEMIGASGISTELHYPDSSQTLGLYDSSSRGGTGFYNHRITGSQYAGVSYQFMDMPISLANGESTTKTSAIMGFYTIYTKSRLSLSVAGGPQYYQISEAPLYNLSAWGPSVATSIGWQTERVNLAANYSHSVTAASGLIGGYRSNSTGAVMRWQLAHTWTAGFSIAYAVNKSVSALLPTANGNGHSVNGSATLEHPIRGQLSLALNYDRVHQSYGQIAAIAANPNIDRVSASISWNFLRLLGR